MKLLCLSIFHLRQSLSLEFQLWVIKKMKVTLNLVSASYIDAISACHQYNKTELFNKFASFGKLLESESPASEAIFSLYYKDFELKDAPAKED